MRCTNRFRVLAAAALTAAAAQAQAIGVTDAVGDYVAGYTGSKTGDLDVVGSFVTYNQSSDKFVFSGTMESDIGSTPGGFYVWGVNRGGGTAGFAVNGVPGVLFDTVVIFRADGTGTVTRTAGAGAGSSALVAGTVQIFGSTIIGTVPGNLLVSNGAAKTAYTWNLWPRDPAAGAGFAQISDFAPDNSNLPVVVVGVSEPGIAWMMAGGLAVLGWRAGRTRRRD